MLKYNFQDECMKFWLNKPQFIITEQWYFVLYARHQVYPSMDIIISFKKKGRDTFVTMISYYLSLFDQKKRLIDLWTDHGWSNAIGNCIFDAVNFLFDYAVEYSPRFINWSRQYSIICIKKSKKKSNLN